MKHRKDWPWWAALASLWTVWGVAFLASCTGYQLVPSVGVGYDPQTGNEFLSASVTNAAPLNFSRQAALDLQPRQRVIPDASADLARLQAENTALKENAARAETQEPPPAPKSTDFGWVSVFKDPDGAWSLWGVVALWGAIALASLVAYFKFRKPKEA